MSNINFEVKRMLEDIIDVAYSTEPEENRKKYKKFWLEIVPKECKTTSGMYCYEGHKIQVYNLSQESKVIVKVCIHELAHHIDLCKNGTSGHQAPFYQEYKALLYAALNMRIITPDDIEKDNWSRDRNKVKKLVSEWVPSYVPYKQDSVKINVANGYAHKDALKERGYKWDNLQTVWSREITKQSLPEEEEFLSDLGCKFTVTAASDLNIEAAGFLVVKGNTYTYKEALKKQGFFYDSKSGKGAWKKKIKLSEAETIIQKLQQDNALIGAVFHVDR